MEKDMLETKFGECLNYMNSELSVQEGHALHYEKDV